jgi:hypothetical protein
MPAARTLGAGGGEAGAEDGAAAGARAGELAGDELAPDGAAVGEGRAGDVAAGDAAGADAAGCGGWADVLCGPHAAAASATTAKGMITRTDADRRGMGTSAAELLAADRDQPADPNHRATYKTWQARQRLPAAESGCCW